MNVMMPHVQARRIPVFFKRGTMMTVPVFHAHKAPTPEPAEHPLPGERPVPQEEPVPSPDPEIITSNA